MFSKLHKRLAVGTGLRQEPRLEGPLLPPAIRVRQAEQLPYCCLGDCLTARSVPLQLPDTPPAKPAWARPRGLIGRNTGTREPQCAEAFRRLVG
jgi:hypothetical protein